MVSEGHGDDSDAYERLIGDAMRGDTALFARQDEVEAAWAIFDPVLGASTPLHEYSPGSWGPEAAQDFIEWPCGWHDPGADSRGWKRSCT
jgi:glucose-6-phosphate 1-dehydrogenase